MTADLLHPTLAWFHIFSAVGWMGAAMFFSMTMGPLMGRLSPQTRSELALKLLPKFTRYMTIFSVLTMGFGAALAISEVGGEMSAFSPASTWGMSISVGVLLTIIAFGLALGVAVPSSRRMVKLIGEFQLNPQGPPPPEIPKLQKRLRSSGLIVLILLTLVLVFMVSAEVAG